MTAQNEIDYFTAPATAEFASTLPVSAFNHLSTTYDEGYPVSGDQLRLATLKESN